MSGNNNSKEKQERQFDEDQYLMLLRCSEEKGITEWEEKQIAEWNEWREANEETPILLEGANLRCSNLEGANLRNSDLKGADLRNSDLKGADLRNSNLKGAKLWYSNLEDADFSNANLEGADFSNANLEGAEIRRADLTDAIFKSVIVDGKTLIWDCNDSPKTDFTGVGLDSARISPMLKERLKNNIRKMKWQDYCHAKAKKFEKKWPWYKFWKKRWWIKLKRKPILLFWQISAYGSSTTEIVKWFWAWALTFALIYLAWGHISPPGIIHDLMDIRPDLSAMRSIYFSVVTMTTLGFGDMHALKGSFCGYLFLTIQVLMGYTLLGALIVRFGILFISSGPSQD